ncbi:hypothetical protein [Caulobacter sp.]|uniref:hypothetical protein n=1 Tax=Caulobacter sp. TaxID=78 RepID=UPI003BB20B85
MTEIIESLRAVTTTDIAWVLIGIVIVSGITSYLRGFFGEMLKDWRNRKGRPKD